MTIKLKTRKSAVKRIIIKKAFFARKKAGKAHFLRRKSSMQKRRLSQPSIIEKSDLSAMRLMLPYR